MQFSWGHSTLVMRLPQPEDGGGRAARTDVTAPGGFPQAREEGLKKMKLPAGAAFSRGGSSMVHKWLACWLVSGLVATVASGQTAGGLVAKNNQAQGGAKLRSVKTARVSGTLTVGGAEGGPLLLE